MLKLLKVTSWIIVAGLAWTIGAMNKLNNGGELSWARSIYKQKVELIKKANSSRRLLFIGGSGTHFGINAQQIEQELGIPVFNMGQHGYLGLNAVLDSVSGEIRRGDIVVVTLEHISLEDDDGIDRLASSFGVAIGHPGLGGVPAKDIAEEIMNIGNPGLKGITISIIEFIRHKKSPRYYSDQLDPRGDPVELKIKTPEPGVLHAPLSSHAYQRLQEFRVLVERKGGILILGLPWMYAKTDAQTVRNVQERALQLSKISPVVYDRESFNLKTDISLFGDTEYHLSDKGREIRSLELAQQLKEVLKPQLGGFNSTSQIGNLKGSNAAPIDYR